MLVKEAKAGDKAKSRDSNVLNIYCVTLSGRVEAESKPVTYLIAGKAVISRFVISVM